MSTKSNFKLKKWYFDGISEDGRALICYSAVMSWRMLSVQYASYLYLDGKGQAHSESRYRDAPLPAIEGDIIRWEDTKLQIRGEWRSAAPPVRTKLHDSEEGYLDWHCHQPAARCHIQLRNEPPITGFGYAECLEMTIPPWKMGFSELRWGRFAHPESPVVWIDLRGEPNRNWIFRGQEMIRDGEATDTTVRIPESDTELILTGHTPIEDKQKIMEVVQSVIGWMPGFDQFTPLHFLKAQETKWRSRGTLISPGQSEKTGWVIHELVKF